jgi:ATP-dependent helicase HepA
VYKRERANQYPQAHLYRLGETFIDHLYTYLQWDDRGQAFALLRVNEDLEWVGFRFDYLVEADLSHVQSILKDSKLNSKAIEHQADGLFPPHIETIFVDIDFNPVEDEELIKILTRPYNKSKDYSLAKSRLAILDDFIEPTQWEKVCNKARRKSEILLRDKKDFGAFCQEKGNQAQEKFDDYIYQLQQRLSYYPSPQLEEELRIEVSLKENLLKGIYQPRLKPDSVGFIVISNQIPCE